MQKAKNIVTIPELNNTISAVVKGEQNLLLVSNLDELLVNDNLKLRDFIRQAFFVNGVEIEFSGKGNYEKGVVIDLDVEQMRELGINPDVLRFGQTVVRVRVNA